jgi:hypothetical protein
MSENTNNWLVEDLPDSTQVPATQKRAYLRKALPNPFSFFWLKLTASLAASPTSRESEIPENSQFSQHDSPSIQQRYRYTCFTDRVDPSLYYILFFPHQRY